MVAATDPWCIHMLTLEPIEVSLPCTHGDAWRLRPVNQFHSVMGRSLLCRGPFGLLRRPRCALLRPLSAARSGSERVGGDLATASDVDGLDFTSAHEFVELGSADAQDRGGFLDGVDSRSAGGVVMDTRPSFRVMVCPRESGGRCGSVGTV